MSKICKHGTCILRSKLVLSSARADSSSLKHCCLISISPARGEWRPTHDEIIGSECENLICRSFFCADHNRLISISSRSSCLAFWFALDHLEKSVLARTHSPIVNIHARTVRTHSLTCAQHTKKLNILGTLNSSNRPVNHDSRLRSLETATQVKR